jgi:HlyD family secretion protein
MKKLLIVIVLGAVAFGAYYLYQKRDGETTLGGRFSSASAAPKRPTTATVEHRNIRFAVTVAGEIGPAEQVSVRPEINGRIEELPVDIGDRVQRGDLLFSLDDTDLQIEISSRETEISSAQLHLEKAKRDFGRDEQLFNENLIARQVFENARTDYELAKNSIERARKNLEMAKERLTKTRIVAPFDCTVLTRPVSVGQAVSGSGGFNSGTEVLTIADLNAMVINAHVNQADVTRLKVGMEVDVQVEAVPGLRVKGVVERIAPQATVRNNVKGFSTRILLKDIDPRIQPGMTANITIPVASAENVIGVPLAAVYTELNPETRRTERFVFVQKGANYERRLVRVGIADYFFAEVQDGLAPGEVVALEKPPEERILAEPSGPSSHVSGSAPSLAGPQSSGRPAPGAGAVR